MKYCTLVTGGVREANGIESVVGRIEMRLITLHLSAYDGYSNINLSLLALLAYKLHGPSHHCCGAASIQMEKNKAVADKEAEQKVSRHRIIQQLSGVCVCTCMCVFGCVVVCLFYVVVSFEQSITHFVPAGLPYIYTCNQKSTAAARTGWMMSLGPCGKL